MKPLIIFYADQPGKLAKLIGRVNLWLPEKMEATTKNRTDLFITGQKIATTKQSMLETLQFLIQTGEIPANLAIWIDCTNQNNLLGYNFTETGQIKTIFPVGTITNLLHTIK